MATDPRPDVEEAVDVLRQRLARADALVCATELQLERSTWSDERRREHLAHLLGATKEAVQAAVDAGGEVAAKLDPIVRPGARGGIKRA